MCSVCSSSAVPLVTVTSCKREKKHRHLLISFFPRHSATLHTKQIPPQAVSEPQFTQRASCATNEATPGSPSPRANPSPHPLLRSGKHPDLQPERSSCSPAEVTHWMSWPMAPLEGERFRGKMQQNSSWKSGVVGKIALPPAQDYQIVSFNKLGINHVLNVS